LAEDLVPLAEFGERKAVRETGPGNADAFENTIAA
jgi:hypothetical protein